MITNLGILNFKSIQGIDLEMKPLTIFTGPNGSGKSNVLEAIALLAQASKLSGNESHMTNIFAKGEFFQYKQPYYKYIAHKGDLNQYIEFKIHFKVNKELVNELQSIKSSFNGLGILPGKISSVGYGISIQPGEREYEIFGAEQRIFINREPLVTIALVRDNGTKSEFQFPESIKGVPCRSSTQIFNPESFKSLRETKKTTEISPTQQTINSLSLIAQVILSFIKLNLIKIYPISGVRGDIEFQKKATGQPTWVGMKGENVIHLLSFLGGLDNREKKSKVNKWSKLFAIDNVTASYKESDSLVSEFEEPVFKFPLNLKLASFGSRQILPIIVQLFWSDPGSIILIEEPEISLHPKAQVDLQKLFADVIKEKKQIICTTHSPFLILALARIIQKGDLNLEDIAIYHLKKTSQGTIADRLSVNERGYVKGYIESFAEVEHYLYEEWAED